MAYGDGGEHKLQKVVTTSVGQSIASPEGDNKSGAASEIIRVDNSRSAGEEHTNIQSDASHSLPTTGTSGKHESHNVEAEATSKKRHFNGAENITGSIAIEHTCGTKNILAPESKLIEKDKSRVEKDSLITTLSVAHKTEPQEQITAIHSFLKFVVKNSDDETFVLRKEDSHLIMSCTFHYLIRYKVRVIATSIHLFPKINVMLPEKPEATLVDTATLLYDKILLPHDFGFEKSSFVKQQFGKLNLPELLESGKFGFARKNHQMSLLILSPRETFDMETSKNSNKPFPLDDRTVHLCEKERPDGQLCTRKTKFKPKRQGKFMKNLQKKAKHVVKTVRILSKKGARFFCCLKCEAGVEKDTLSTAVTEPTHGTHSVSFKAFYPNVESDNKQPPELAFEDEYQRWRTFHRLGHQRLPTQTLARSGLFYNDSDMTQCHSCRRVSELSDAVHSPTSGICHYPHCHYANRSSQVSSDTPGRISDDVRDPPGQQSIYIPPGDVRQESYRISTFENFPVPSTSSRRSLAQAGFFFTGFFDRVKCFACGRTVQEWVATDNPADRKWHKDDCPFMRGENCGNVAIATHFNQLYGNLSTRPTQGNPGEEVIQQRDPVTGSIIRTVRYPADLPERIRQTGGTFEIGPNNQVTIRSGPGTGGRSHGPGLQEAPARLPATPLQQAQHQPMRHWRMANVISADHKRFLTNLYLNRELDRVASFARWPTGRPNVAPAALAKTGFFYLGDMDRTQCFSCGGVLRNWTAEDDAASEHRAHFPNCRLLLGTETQNVPVPDLPVATDVRQRDFPCRFPSNPHMRSEAARVETFDQRWPRNRTAATPAEIAQAGFFYLGERDRVKCWYCNGGLQHWEYDDVPWIEHAKWFPNCQFLLSVKGQHFVYRHLAMCPQLPRPIIARQDGSPLDPGSERQPSQPPEDIPPSVSRLRQPSPPPTIIDPQEEMRKKQERIDSVLKSSDLVKNVLAMGFSEQIVRQLLVEKVDSGTEESADDIYGTTLGLLDDVMKREEELKQEEEQRSNIAAAVPPMPGPSTSYMPSIPSVYMPTPQSSLGPAPGSGKYNVSYFGDEDEEGDRDMYGIEPMAVETSMNSETPAKQIEGGEDPTSLQEALNKIEEERMCKVCFSNPADMVFVPCGHMCCCMECTKALRQCPVCRVKIQKAIKTYLS